MAKMHVMIDARYIQTKMSGIGRYTEQIIMQLLEIEPELRLSLITHPSNPVPMVHERVRHQTFAAAPNSLRTRMRLARSVDFSDVDLFHAPFNMLPAHVPTPSVFTLHDIMWLLDANYCTDSALRRAITGTFYKKYIPASVKQATRVMTVSHHSKETIEDYFPHMKGRVHVTYNGLDPFFCERPKHESWSRVSRFVPPRSPFVLVVGQGSPYKNHAGALAAFIEAFRHDPDVYFVLVRRFARGPQQKLHELMQDEDVRARIVHLEYVTGEELCALYNAASVFLFPSFYEGFGLPVLEAMACGTPVVTSNVGAPSEVAGDAAFKADPYDVASMASALTLAMYDEDARARMRTKGLERAASFPWRRCAEQVLEVYNLALKDQSTKQT